MPLRKYIKVCDDELSAVVLCLNDAKMKIIIRAKSHANFWQVHFTMDKITEYICLFQNKPRHYPSLFFEINKCIQ